MNKNILDKAVQNYINLHLNADVSKIALAKSPFEGVSSAELAAQITAKKKSKKKLPTWFKTEGIFYPVSLSIEQTSSEITAKNKAELAIGENLIDITGGFGVDALYFAKKIKDVTHCEINADLSEIARHNASKLGANNINFRALDGTVFLKKTSLTFDTIYVDPARRAVKGKVFMLKDCSPDVVSNLDLLLSKSKRILVKTAPLLDITAGLAELKQVSEIHIVSIKNECKELLWVVDKDYSGDTKITATTLNSEQKSFSFLKSEINTEALFATELTPNIYLYEPDAALLKSGAFNLIGQRYNLQKLHSQTQLYSSIIFNLEFAGRIFKIEEIYSAGDFKKLSQVHANGKNLMGNVLVRNYPAKPEDLVKKHKIKPDKDIFWIFTKTNFGNLVIKGRILQYY